MDETLLQRWLDDELDEAQAAAFLTGLEEADRREALALAAVGDAARHLPRARPSPDFTARAMARVRTRRPPRRSVWTWLRAPRVSPLAALGAAAAAAALTFGALAWRAPSTPAAAPAGGGSLVVARLALRAPGAREVAVAADFNGWNPAASRMQRGEGGVWTLEVPLPPGRRYQYMFVVDGQFVPDPAAPASVDDGFGGKNAVLSL